MRRKEELSETYDIKSWQSIHVSQLSYVRNLFIILSVTLIGFIVSLLFSKNTNISNIETLMKLNAIAFLIPLAIGIWVSINESKNFRFKYKASRFVKRCEVPEKDERFNQIEVDCKAFIKRTIRILFKKQLKDEEFNQIEVNCTCIEKLNRILFKIQLCSFFGCLIFLIVTLFIKS